MKIDRLNGYTLVAKTNFPLFSFICLFVIIACGVGFFSSHQSEYKTMCAAGMVIFALIAAVVTRRSETTFDSRKKEITVASGCLSLKKMETIAFSEIKGVKIERSSIGGDTFGRIVLVMDHTVVPLSPNLHRVTARLEKDAKQLIRFVDCPDFDSSYEPTSAPKKNTGSFKAPLRVTQTFNIDDINPEVIDLIRKKRSIEAIKVMRSTTGLGLKESKDVVDEIQRRMRSSED